MFIYSEMLYLIFHTAQKESCYRVILHMGGHMAECIIISKYCPTPKKAIISLQIKWTQHQKEVDSLTFKMYCLPELCKRHHWKSTWKIVQPVIILISKPGV